MSVQAFVDEGLGNSAYLVDVGGGRALAIDPPRDVSRLRAAAESRRLAIGFTVETHLHADFVSGSRELAALGATVVAARAAGLEFAHRPLDDGDALDLGGLDLEAIATPGHTPEHLSYLLRDGGRPLALFSGGALLAGSVARTDLIDPERTESLARALYRSLHGRLLSLADDVPVYPTHGGGSFCATVESHERTTTIGRERAANALLRAPDEDAFVALLARSFGTYPTYFARLREFNRRGPRVVGRPPVLAPLGLAEVDRLLEGGSEIVDVRPKEAFAAGHLPGALAIALRPSFGSWLGWLVPDDRSLVFVLDAGQDRTEVVRQALGIGHENLAGELAGGVGAWLGAGRPLALTDLTRRPASGRPIVDVRQASEVRAGHVAGAFELELGSFAEAAAEIPDGATIMCGAGDRAMTAASLLARRGRRATVFWGSPDDWARDAGVPLERGD